MTWPRKMNTPCGVPWKESSWHSRQLTKKIVFFIKHIGQSIHIVLQYKKLKE